MKKLKLLTFAIAFSIGSYIPTKLSAKLSFNDAYKYHCALKETLRTPNLSKEEKLKTYKRTYIYKLNLFLGYNSGYLVKNVRNNFHAMDLGYDEKGKKRIYKDDKPIGNKIDGRIAGIVRLLFPSPAGDLSLNANAQYSKHLQKNIDLKKTADLLSHLLLGKGKESNNYQEWDENFFSKEKVDNSNLEKIVSYIEDSVLYIKKYGFESEKSFLNVILLTYACEKIDNMNDLINFIKQIESNFSLKGLNENFKSKKSIKFDENELNLVKTELKNEKSDVFALALFACYVNGYNEIHKKTPYATNTIISNANVNPIGQDGKPTGEPQFADCVETSNRHICNYLFYDAIKREFLLPDIKDKTKKDKLAAFYKKQSSLSANDGSTDMRTNWNKVVSNLENVSYVLENSKLNSKTNNIINSKNELETGFINMLSTLNEIMGRPIDLNDIQNLYSVIQNEKDAKNTKIIEDKIIDKFKDIFSFMGNIKKEDINLEFYNFEIDKPMSSKKEDRRDAYGSILVTIKKLDYEFKFHIHHKIGHTEIEKMIEDNKIKEEYEITKNKINSGEKYSVRFLNNLLFILTDLERESIFDSYNKYENDINLFYNYGLSSTDSDYKSKVYFMFTLTNKKIKFKHKQDFEENIGKILRISCNEINLFDNRVFTLICVTFNENFKKIINKYQAIKPGQISYDGIENRYTPEIFVNRISNIYDFNWFEIKKLQVNNNRHNLLFEDNYKKFYDIFIKNNKKLETLIIEYRQEDKDLLDCIVFALKNNDKMKKFEFTRHFYLKENTLEDLTNTLKDNKNLTRLQFIANQMTILNYSKTNDLQNTTLSLDLNDENLDYLIKALESDKTLKTLDLNYLEKNEKFAELVSESLKKNTSLASLYLSGIGDEGAKFLAEAIKINTTITTINLNENKIGDEGAKFLAEALKENTTVTTINLNDNKIGDEGAKFLSEALKENTTVTTINLNDNKIGDEGAKLLKEALEKNKNIKNNL